MSQSNFVSIANLTQGVRLKDLTVRVIYRWNRPNYTNKNTTEAIELLLIDAKNDLVQTTIKKPLLSRFNDKFVSGQVYSLRSLTVAPNVGVDKATTHTCRLNVEFSTKVTHLPNDVSVPSNCYRFVSFKDINNGKIAVNQYIDVVGKVYEIGPITETKNGFKCRKIKLEDTNGDVLQCTLWAPHAVDLPEVLAILPNPHQSKVVVLRCVEPKLFDNSWVVQTTFNATTFEVNPKFPKVDAFQESLSSQAPSNSLQIIDEAADGESFHIPVDEVLSVKQILESEKGGSFYTVATIIDIESTAGWYYNSCKSCRSKAVKNDKGRWFCKNPNCDGSKTCFMKNNPKFQVKFAVADFSGIECQFAAFDHQVEKFLDYSATELIAKMEKNGEGHSMPAELATFIDNRFLFKIKIDEKFNVEQSSTSYTVSWMSDDVDKIHMWHMKYEEAIKKIMDEYGLSKTTLSNPNFKRTVHGEPTQPADATSVGVHEVQGTSHSSQVVDSEIASNSSRHTPLKRNGDSLEVEPCTLVGGASDAQSAVKKGKSASP